MPKKFYDILPPRKENPKKKEKVEKPKKRVFLKSLILSVLALISVAVFGFFFFSDIEIEIYPYTEQLDFEYAVKVSEAFSGDVEEWLREGVIPAEKVDVEKMKTKTYQTTGKRVQENKAGGAIRVYNAHSTQNQTLVGGTRFVSSEGKLFKSLKGEVIKGGHYEGGQFVPGYTDVEVEAAEPGEEYNIGPTTFSIPGFAGTSKYTTFYGKSFSEMTGGFTGEVSQVSQDDLDRAEEDLLLEAKRDNLQFLEKNLPGTYVVLPGALSHEVLEESFSKEEGEAVDSFEYNIRLRSEGLAFDREKMERFAIGVITSTVSEDMVVEEESFDVNFSVESLSEEEADLSLNIKALVYSDIDLDKVKKTISGESLNEAKLFLGRLPGIDRIEVVSWPFWRRSLPEREEEINLIMRLD